MFLHILKLDPAVVAPGLFRVGDSFKFPLGQLLLCLQGKFMFDILVLSLDLLFTNIVLMALQDVQLDAVEVGTLLVAQAARILLTSHTLSGKLKKLAHPEMFLSQLNL